MEQLGCIKVRRDTGEIVEILPKTRADNVCMCDNSGKTLDVVLEELNDALRDAGKKQTVSVEVIDGVTNLVITESDGTQTKTPIVSSGGGGGGGVTSWNDLEDRPFGEEPHYIFPETELTFVAEPEMGGMSAVMVEVTESPADGTEFTVTFNGVEYVYTYLPGAPFFGNMSIFGEEDTGEPFFGQIGGGMLLLVNLVSESATVSIRVSNIKPIGNEFIPEPDLIDLVELGLPTVTDLAVSEVDIGEEFSKYEKYLKHRFINLRLKVRHATLVLRDIDNTSKGGGVYDEDIIVSAQVQTMEYNEDGGMRECTLSAFIDGNILFVYFGSIVQAVIRHVDYMKGSDVQSKFY